MIKGERNKAIQEGEKYYFTGKPCKNGHIEKRLTANGSCSQCSKDAFNKRYESYYKNWVIENRDKVRQTASKYQKNNKGKVNSRTATRHAAKMQRTPSWVSKEEKWLIEEIYNLAALRTKVTGIPWHVDHVVPLQAANASGLHVPENLRVVTYYENCSKNNSWDWEQQR